MPALPSAKLQSLKSAKKGSFVTVKNPKDTMEFALRAALAPVEKSDKEEPVFVKLTPRAGGRCEAQLVSSGPRLPNEWIVGSSTRVVNHTNDWTLQVLRKTGMLTFTKLLAPQWRTTCVRACARSLRSRVFQSSRGLRNESRHLLALQPPTVRLVSRSPTIIPGREVTYEFLDCRDVLVERTGRQRGQPEPLRAAGPVRVPHPVSGSLLRNRHGLLGGHPQATGGLDPARRSLGGRPQRLHLHTFEVGRGVAATADSALIRPANERTQPAARQSAEVLSTLPKAAEMFRRQVELELDGDPRARIMW
jgi:hypothetical protein